MRLVANPCCLLVLPGLVWGPKGLRTCHNRPGVAVLQLYQVYFAALPVAFPGHLLMLLSKCTWDSVQLWHGCVSIHMWWLYINARLPLCAVWHWRLYHHWGLCSGLIQGCTRPRMFALAGSCQMDGHHGESSR